jgi:hypothetical protein
MLVRWPAWVTGSIVLRGVVWDARMEPSDQACGASDSWEGSDSSMARIWAWSAGSSTEAITPDCVQVESEIVVDDAVSEACDLLPGDFGVVLLEFAGDLESGFARDAQLAEDRVVDQAAGQKFFLADIAEVSRHGAGGFRDVAEPQGVTPHRGHGRRGESRRGRLA